MTYRIVRSSEQFRLQRSIGTGADRDGDSERSLSTAVHCSEPLQQRWGRELRRQARSPMVLRFGGGICMQFRTSLTQNASTDNVLISATYARHDGDFAAFKEQHNLTANQDAAFT